MVVDFDIKIINPLKLIITRDKLEDLSFETITQQYAK